MSLESVIYGPVAEPENPIVSEIVSDLANVPRSLRGTADLPKNNPDAAWGGRLEDFSIVP